jgi:very-short-patch-repair endonuclease
VPGLAVNLPIITSGGYKYRADIAMPVKRVIVEYQSLLHMTPERYRADMTRRSRLEADGWFVIEVNAQDLADPGELVSRVTRVLAGRAPWPDDL